MRHLRTSAHHVCVLAVKALRLVKTNILTRTPNTTVFEYSVTRATCLTKSTRGNHWSHDGGGGAIM